MKKKQKLANYIMVAVIILIFGAGILVTGHLQGWFDKDDSSAALLTDIRGIITMERNGVAYQVDTDTSLRQGDKITCGSGATAVISVNNSQLTLASEAQVEVKDPSLENFSATVSTGEIFADATDPVTLSFEGNDVLLENTVVCLSVRKGAQSVSIFSGTVNETEAGQVLNWLGQDPSATPLSISSLNDFTIQQLRQINKNKPVCFTTKELDKVLADRQAEKKAQADAAHKSSATTPTKPGETTPVTKATDPKAAETTAATEPKEPNATTPEATEPKPTESKPTEPASTKPASTSKPTESASKPTEPAPTEPAPTEPAPTDSSLSCTITIRCDTILDNWDNLDPAKAPYVPSDGVILYTVDASFTEGETVFEVLNRVCSDYGIQLEYSWTPMYNSYYIEGINNLYEFDCGSESGWMYKVNGWFPNYGCSSYTLEDGDSIVWCYTCNGLGADVGGGVW